MKKVLVYKEEQFKDPNSYHQMDRVSYQYACIEATEESKEQIIKLPQQNKKDVATYITNA